MFADGQLRYIFKLINGRHFMITKKLSQLLTILGTLLMLYAIIGRFLYAQTVLGFIFRPGISAQAVLTGANTLLILAILAHLYTPKD